jgi:putative molybdopterin biosynthesis protein
MAFTYLTNIPLERAKADYLEHLLSVGVQPKTELIATVEANHRVTAEAVYAQISAPHYNACAMDGIALDAAKTYSANEINPVALTEADFFWVNTGDPLPAGCDCVVMVEDVILENNQVALYGAASPWQHVRQIGEDIAAGDMIVPSFEALTPAALGALLAAGVLELQVIKKPLVGFIPTGNEIVSPKADPKPGEIIEFNSTIFAGMVEDWGCESRVFPIVQDQPEAIEHALRVAVEECDLVLLNAGSSAGAKDYAVEAINKVGEVALHGIAIKPGKPTILAHAKTADQVVPVIGLPGYPVSGILVMELLVKDVMQLLTKSPSTEMKMIHATSSRRLTSSLKYLEFVRARIGNVNGKRVAIPLNRGAGVVSSFVKADGIIRIPQDVEGYEAGEVLDVQLLRPIEEIDRTVVITGSHDPLIDEVTDLMKHRYPADRIASSHVGSLGGILAIKRGEAHLGGVHLLDEDSGEYNLGYLKKYFPEGGVVLLSCVKRTQGLMVAKGNPLGIRSIHDLPRISYVNRQKGSGTRILIDYLMHQAGLDIDVVRGYQREEFTHTAVAAAVASGTADAGLGIYAAAKIYGLDFIPVGDEQYDLLVAASAMELDAVQHIITVLKSETFAERIIALGGYEMNHPGEERKWN